MACLLELEFDTVLAVLLCGAVLFCLEKGLGPWKFDMFIIGNVNLQFKVQQTHSISHLALVIYNINMYNAISCINSNEMVNEILNLYTKSSRKK